MKSKRPKRIFLGSVEEDILQHLTAGDFLMSFLHSGGSTRALYREAYKRARARYRYKRGMKSLEARGLVERSGDALHLTKQGKEMLEIIASRSSQKGMWHGRWWIVMYDVPVSMNTYRFDLRWILIKSGFRKLQHSVWINPHPCRELEIFLRDNPAMNKYVRYVEVLPFTHMNSVEDWKKLPKS